MVNTVKNLLICYICTRNYLKRVIQKVAEATSDIIGKKIAIKITTLSMTSPQKILETGNIGFDAKMLKERSISPEQRQQINDELRVI